MLPWLVIQVKLTLKSPKMSSWNHCDIHSPIYADIHYKMATKRKHHDSYFLQIKFQQNHCQACHSIPLTSVQ